MLQITILRIYFLLPPLIFISVKPPVIMHDSGQCIVEYLIFFLQISFFVAYCLRKSRYLVVIHSIYISHR